jgi:hypothetical protein
MPENVDQESMTHRELTPRPGETGEVSTRVDERREFPRVDGRDTSVRFKILDDAHVLSEYTVGQTRNVSFGGVSFASTTPVRPGCLLVIEIRLDGDKSPVSALGTVVRCDEGSDGFVLAVEFLWTGCEELTHQKLQKFVRERLLVD